MDVTFSIKTRTARLTFEPYVFSRGDYFDQLFDNLAKSFKFIFDAISGLLSSQRLRAIVSGSIFATISLPARSVCDDVPLQRGTVNSSLS